MRRPCPLRLLRPLHRVRASARADARANTSRPSLSLAHARQSRLKPLNAASALAAAPVDVRNYMFVTPIMCVHIDLCV